VAILSGELDAGRTYTQGTLSEQLGVGRTPLREAIRRLQSEGLLESERNRRIRVSPLDPDDLEQLYTLRLTLEALAVRISVPKLTEKDLKFVRQALDDHNRAWQAGQIELAEARHRDFHFRLFSHAGDRIRSLAEELWDHAARYRRAYAKSSDTQIAYLQLAVPEHEGIFEAASLGDADLCARRSAQHMARTVVTLSASVDGSLDLSDVRLALKLVQAEADS